MRGLGLSVHVLFALAGAAAALAASAGSIALLGDVMAASSPMAARPAKAQGAPLLAPASPLPAVESPARALPDAPAGDGGAYTPVTFDTLAGFRYGEAGSKDIPAEVAELDGQRVAVRGYMVPVTLGGDGKVRTFLLTENQLLCCYGVMPALNEWIAVEMADGEGAALHVDRPVDVSGTLSVGESTDASGAESLYRLEGRRVTGVVGRGLFRP